MSLDIYEKLELPEKNSPISKAQGEEIFSFLKEKNIKNTLEVGFCFGCSAAHIISATKSKHIAIDPFQKEAWNNLGLKNINKLGIKEFLRFENDFSYNALPKLLKEGIKIDFAFIDGMHLFDYILVDFFYVDLLLNKNGYVLFDDTWMRSTQVVEDWIKTNKKNYKFIKKSNNLLLFQKISEDDRRWDHFVEFNNKVIKFFLGRIKN